MSTLELWAHRGSHGGDVVENTLPAFERALAEAPTGIELDIQLSADGVPLVFHDEELTRMTQGQDARPLRGLGASTLQAIDLGGGITMPTLADVLDLVGQRCPVNVEIKDASALDAVARTLRDHRTEILLSSFDHDSMEAARVRLPKVPRALVMGTDTHHLGVRFRESFPFWALARADAVAWHAHQGLVSAPLLRALRRMGIMTRTWTVNDPRRAAELGALGVDGVFTDCPAGMTQGTRMAPPTP